MAQDVSLMRTSIEVRREYRISHACYYKLIIVIDPASLILIIIKNFKNLLRILPNLLSIVNYSYHWKKYRTFFPQVFISRALKINALFEYTMSHCTQINDTVLVQSVMPAGSGFARAE